MQPDPLRPNQLYDLRTSPHRGKHKSSREVTGANPVYDLHEEVEIKPQLKSRGSVAKEEDPKPSHTLYKLQIKST